LRVADQSIDGISFHDCVVRAVARRGGDLMLSVDLLEPAGGGVLTLRAVTAIWVDGILTDEMVMEGEDGEIHRIDRVDDGIEMFIAWARYQPHREIYRDYRIICGGAVWSAP
jgi:hypothetical protein